MEDDLNGRLEPKYETPCNVFLKKQIHNFKLNEEAWSANHPKTHLSCLCINLPVAVGQTTSRDQSEQLWSDMHLHTSL